MSKSICTLIIIVFGFSAFAQEQENNTQQTDTTVVKKNEIPKDSTVNEPSENDAAAVVPVVAEKDTIKPVPVPVDTVPKVTEVPDEPEIEKQNVQTEEPRIIYYQTVRDDDRDDYDRYSNRRKKRNEVKTIAGTMSHSGGFGALSFKSTKLRDESIVFAGLRGGWIVNRTLGIGFEAYGAIPTAKFDDIIPERVVTLGGYGGMFLELIFFSNQVVHVTFPVSGGAGWLGYYEDWENSSSVYSDDLISDDVFWYVEPGVDLELNVSRNFRLAGGISRRFTQDLQMIQTRGKDFDTMSYFITLKVGSF